METTKQTLIEALNGTKIAAVLEAIPEEWDAVRFDCGGTWISSERLGEELGTDEAQVEAQLGKMDADREDRGCGAFGVASLPADGDEDATGKVWRDATQKWETE